ncbi:hypothetical protein T265_10088 [Opisthorchis viverrini]|uniref:Uncharacterized protein n=1 Tax=Opisthorchis viverrini TaxID=6198 RepID=A0A075A2P1_OPIVI|nr:hypothetical protein T265_10088 [Opisthorchis viverrini]KER21644.1 hypothetical protein T265_10088 [Opisthorchis viverrini]
MVICRCVGNNGSITIRTNLREEDWKMKPAPNFELGTKLKIHASGEIGVYDSKEEMTEVVQKWIVYLEIRIEEMHELTVVWIRQLDGALIR